MEPRCRECLHVIRWGERTCEGCGRYIPWPKDGRPIQTAAPPVRGRLPDGLLGRVCLVVGLIVLAFNILWAFGVFHL